MFDQQKSRWRFARKVIVPTILAFLLSFGQVVGFMLFSVQHTDAEILAKQTTLLSLAVDDLTRRAGHAQLDLAIWDEPLEAYAEADFEWFDNNFSNAGPQQGRQNRDYILNPDLTPFLALRGGSVVPTTDFDRVREPVIALAQTLFSPLNQVALLAYKADDQVIPPRVSTMAIIDGQPAFLSIAPLVSNTRTLNAAPGMEPLYVAITMMDATVANDIADRLLMRGARFDTNPAVSDSETAMPVLNAQGEPVAWFKWLPDRPGVAIAQAFLPALAAAFVVTTITIALLLRQLHNAGTQLFAERADAQYRALHDPLTGLGNRALFRDRLEQAFLHLPRAAPAMALLALDLDRFKQVNDTLGHDAGDELLRQVSSRLANILRPTDTLVRLGGDEFAILQTAITSTSEAANLARRVLGVVGAPYDIDGRPLEIGISIGIATAPDDARSESELVRRADNALYRAKTAGRNRFCFYDESALPPLDGDDAPQHQLSLGFA